MPDPLFSEATERESSAATPRQLQAGIQLGNPSSPTAGTRYTLQTRLAHNPGRQTWLAKDQLTSQTVVIKLVLFGQGLQWSDHTLFEREASTLQHLNHPNIPRYLDSFELQGLPVEGFALVQTYIEAPSLSQHLAAGRRFSESELRSLASQLLELLNYLHTQLPPVIHRDLKPSNILLGDRSAHSPGQVYLIDFGSVKSQLSNSQDRSITQGHSITIVGSYGYMAPEQYHGKATPISDLYALGATLLYLATGEHPNDLPSVDGQLHLDPQTNLSPALLDWLKRLYADRPSQRFPSAQMALNALNALNALDHANSDALHPANTSSPSERAPTHRSPSDLLRPPAGSRIQLSQTPDRLDIKIPPLGLHFSLVFLAPFAIAWNSFVLFWTLGVLASAPFPLSLPFALFSLPFWAVGIGMLGLCLFILWGSIEFHIDHQEIACTYHLLGWHYQKPKPARRQDIDRITYTPQYITRDSDGDRTTVMAQLKVIAGTREFCLGGSSGGLDSEAEVEWLATVVSQWLNLPLTRQSPP